MGWYKYIIIDEFQDIARQRFNLTKRLSEIGFLFVLVKKRKAV